MKLVVVFYYSFIPAFGLVTIQLFGFYGQTIVPFRAIRDVQVYEVMAKVITTRVIDSEWSHFLCPFGSAFKSLVDSMEVRINVVYRCPILSQVNSNEVVCRYLFKEFRPRYFVRNANRFIRVSREGIFFNDRPTRYFKVVFIDVSSFPIFVRATTLYQNCRCEVNSSYPYLVGRYFRTNRG